MTTKTKAILYVALTSEEKNRGVVNVQKILNDEHMKFSSHFPDLDLLAVPDYSTDAITRVVKVEKNS